MEGWMKKVAGFQLKKKRRVQCNVRDWFQRERKEREGRSERGGGASGGQLRVAEPAVNGWRGDAPFPGCTLSLLPEAAS